MNVQVWIIVYLVARVSIEGTKHVLEFRRAILVALSRSIVTFGPTLAHCLTFFDCRRSSHAFEMLLCLVSCLWLECLLQFHDLLMSVIVHLDDVSVIEIVIFVDRAQEALTVLCSRDILQTVSSKFAVCSD